MLKKSLCLSAMLSLLPLPSWAMEFVEIPAGCFVMGRDANFEQGDDSELPQHKVCLDAFQMGKYEVTQAEWVAVMGSNLSNFKGRTNPVEQVSWDDAKVFIKQLNKIDGSNKYRLPSEAEWEYAARAGATTI
jgi:formylglycine-generating enzyme required for sulfatase activity